MVKLRLFLHSNTGKMQNPVNVKQDIPLHLCSNPQQNANTKRNFN